MTSFNIHPIFMMLYDPYWTAFQQMEPILTRTLGDSWQLLPDFWVWNVAKGKDNLAGLLIEIYVKNSKMKNGHPTLLTLYIINRCNTIKFMYLHAPNTLRPLIP